MIWLNRVGIVLDLIAGLLLTPQIFGLDRLRSLEKRAETALSSLTSFTDSFYQRLSELWLILRENLVLLWLIVPILLVTGYIGLDSISFPLMIEDYLLSIGWGCISGYLFAESGRSKAQKAYRFPLGFLLGFVLPYLLLPLVGVSVLLAYITIPVLIRVSLLTRKAISYILDRLEGNDRLLGLLTGMGIIALILGSLFQLISTF